MELKPQSLIMDDYLQRTEIVDFDHYKIKAFSSSLSRNVSSKPALVKRLYGFVRDAIKHSADTDAKVITCNASSVLMAQEGICFSKSHLLAALLRLNDIPAGFCYQLLRLNGLKSPLVLHGLNAVYIESLRRWIRLDARGNKPGINARFSLDEEHLAFTTRPEFGEKDDPIIYTDPNAHVVELLMRSHSFETLWINIPTCLTTIPSQQPADR